MSTQEQSIEESLSTIIRHHNNGIFTSMPGHIVKLYDLNDKRFADIKPDIKDTRIKDGQKISIEYPVIPMVPIFIQGTEEFYMSFPVKVGNPCMLHFAQHSIDKYLLSDGKTDIDSEDTRRHDINDAYCTIGNILPYFNIPGISSDDLVIGKVDDSTKIIITSAGEVQIKASEVKLGSTTANKALALAEKVESRFNSFENNYNFHTHIITSPGAPSLIHVTPVVGPHENLGSSKVFADS